MGFWNKLGKIALQAAPYVAAPFTAGASLYALPATQKLGEKWAEHDAKKAIEKGVAPSKFDKYLGMASNVAGFASGTGALGKFGSAAYSAGKAGTAAKALSGWQNKIKQGGQIASMAMGGSPYAGQANYTGNVAQSAGSALGGWQGALASGIGEIMRGQDSGSSNQTAAARNPSPSSSSRGPVMPRGGFSYEQNPMNRRDQSTPNLAESIFQGRQESLHSQPFRAGSTVYTKGDEEGQVITQQLPPIYSQYEEPTPIANRFGDELTPRMPTKRKRNPEPVEEEYN